MFDLSQPECDKYQPEYNIAQTMFDLYQPKCNKHQPECKISQTIIKLVQPICNRFQTVGIVLNTSNENTKGIKTIDIKANRHPPTLSILTKKSYSQEMKSKCISLLDR